MQRVDPKSGSSGWEWGSQPPPNRDPYRRPPPGRRGALGVALAAILFVGVVSLATAAIVMAMSDDGSEAPSAIAEPEATPTGAPAIASDPALAAPQAGVTGTDAAAADTKAIAKLREQTAWTTDAASTLDELSRAWSIPREVLAALNPDLTQGPIAVGSPVIVHSHTFPGSISVGSPNDGQLIRGVPLPEGRAWQQPFDRTRAFATVETIASLTTALEAYGERFSDAEPIQIGDLSQRNGGRIYGHQSHQSGRDVDIRLIHDAAGNAFDPQRNWFLVKTLVDRGDVTAIFLNAKQQTWLRVAAEADVGAAAVAHYFELIKHEKGHTIHMHVRFHCPDASHRCVAYSLPDHGEEPPKTAKKLLTLRGKLPGQTTGGTSKLPPVLRPKVRPPGEKPNRKLPPR